MTKHAFLMLPMLLQSLPAFVISIIGPQVIKTFFKTTSETLFASLAHHLGKVTYPPNPEQEPAISSIDPGFGVDKRVIELGWGAYESYVWYMGMMLILEIVISLVNTCSKHSTKRLTSVSEKPIYGYQEGQNVSNKIKTLIMHIVKTIFIYSLCYLIYLVIIVGICLVCNIYNQSGGSNQRQELSLSEIRVQSPEELSIKSHEPGINKNHLGSARMLVSSPLNSMVIQDMTNSSNILISSMTFSNGGSVAFLASYSNSNQTCSLLITNVSEAGLTDPYIGFISFSFNGTVGPLSSNTYPLSLALSSDDTIVFMTTPSALQIINISNLTSLVSIANSTMSSTEFLYSVTLSPDDRTAFLLIHSTSAGYQIVAMDVESRKFISILDSSSQPYYSLYAYEKSIFVSASGLSVWRVYNISDVSNITLQEVLDFGGFDGVQSVGFSGDFETAYVGTSLNGSGYINIVNISGNAISNKISTTPLASGFDLDYMASIVESPDGRHLFISGNPALQIFDISDPASPISLAPTNIPGPASMVLTPDGRQAIFVKDSGNYYFISFNLNLRLSQAISLQNNVINTLDASPGLTSMVLSPDGRTLYVSTGNSSLLVVNMTNTPNYTLLPSFPVLRPPTQMIISPDGEYLFALSMANVSGNIQCSFDIYDILDAQYMSSFNLTSPDYFNQPNQSFAITPDGDLAVIIQTRTTFVILDISNRTHPVWLSTTYFFSFSIPFITLSADGQTAFIGAEELYVYDISTPSAPKPLGEVYFPIISTLSPNADIFYAIIKLGDVGSCVLAVFDTSTLNVIYPITLLETCYNDYATSMIVPILPDGLALMVSIDSYVVVVDISILEIPILIGAYTSSAPVLRNGIGVTTDYSTLLVGGGQGVTMISLKPDYIINNFMLTEISMGETVTQPLNVLKKNSQGTYDASVCNYRFTGLSMYNPVANNMISQLVQTYKELANWLIFDQGTGHLTVATDLKTINVDGASAINLLEIGELFASLSRQIPNTAFLGTGSINNTNASVDLMVALVGVGYIDSEGYLTPSFDPDQPLLLGSKYMDDEVDIRRAMAGYYIQAWTSFRIAQSLGLDLSNSDLSILTLSSKTINVFISLENAMFVTHGYPFSVSFSPNNTQASIIGSLLNVNDILPQLIIFLNGTESCDGNISVADSLNPSIFMTVPDISSYFRKTSQPVIDEHAFEVQLNNVSVVTGDQFFIPFNSSIFTDLNNEPLTFSLEMQDNHSGVPYWLQLKGFTLVGSPPMQLTDRDLQLKIVVKNQYESAHIDFTLSVGLSFEYILKLVATYGGAIITAFGLYVYATTIYNIFAKRVYTYPRDFEIGVGEEVTDKTLFPIAFHRAALRESRLIMSHMDKTIREKYYFCKPEGHNLDHKKLTKMIEETAGEIYRQDKTKLKLKLKLYTKGTETDRDLIKQLIINSFMIRLLDLKDEKPTKVAFEQIKKEIFNLVELDVRLENGCCKFSVNKPKLQEKLRDHNIRTFRPMEDNEEEDRDLLDSEEELNMSKKKVRDSFQSLTEKSQPNQKSLEKVLLTPGSSDHHQQRSEANMNCLIDAIEAYAFNSHVIDSDVFKIDVIAREKMTDIWPPKIVKRFLKLDLKPMGFSGKGVIGCGIRYQFQENVLVFSGTADENIKDLTLAIQVVNRRGRILRELWLNKSATNKKQKVFNKTKEKL